jgi:hypothetical protein
MPQATGTLMPPSSTPQGATSARSSSTQPSTPGASPSRMHASRNAATRGEPRIARSGGACPEDPNPYGMVAKLLDRLPSGSYLAVSHPTADFDPQAMAGAVAAAEQAGVTLVPRSRAETEAFFTGLELVEPGVVPVLTWRPDDQPPTEPHSAYYWAGIGRKP